jgi:hypothetical protein
MGKLKTFLYLFFLIMLSLSGCKQGSKVPGKGINQQEAIDAAIKIASHSQPEISGSQEFIAFLENLKTAEIF